MESGAVISDCGLYRYELTRSWDDEMPTLEWVMLNPSTADAQVDDPTIRRCIGFAKLWMYGGIVVHNLFAYRSSSPAALADAEDPIGPDNHWYLSNRHGLRTMAGWGSHPAAQKWWNGEPYDISSALRRGQLLCLGTTGNGSPKHPLYVPSATHPVPWRPHA